MIILEFHDILGNIIQIRMMIDLIKQIKHESCWKIESRKIFPIKTEWDIFPPLENQYFNTEDEAKNRTKEYLFSYIEKAKYTKETCYFEEISKELIF